MEGPVVEQTAPQQAMSSVAGAVPVAPMEGNTENSSLYVGDLDKDVQETHLFEIFSQIGPVHSIRVCRDTVTRRSLGYAYVNYNTQFDPDAAKIAKENLNYKEIQGKPIRIMWANRNPTARKDKEGNIFIKNLEKDVTTRMLHDTFNTFGNILSCKVALDKDLKSKGYGFVHFEDPAAAKAAIEQVDGMRLGESEKIVHVCEFLSRTERGDPRQLFTNLYIKNLPDSVATKEDLERMFSEFGSISSAVLMKDQRTDRFFGFINFETSEAAANAKNEMHDKEIDGHKLFVDRAQTKSERSDFLARRYEQRKNALAQQWEVKNVYVKNLATEVDEAMLKEAFEEYGEIVNTKIMRDSSTKVPRGFGFVLFAEADQAAKAVSKMHEQSLSGKKLYVTLAQSKAARQQQLQEMMKNNMMPPTMGMPFPARGMNAMPPAMQGMNMGYMQPYPGMMPYGMGRGQMMPNPMQYQMQGKRSMQNGNAKQSNAAGGPMMMPGGMPMQFMPNMMTPSMMGPAGMMHPVMGGQRGGRGGRGGRGQGRAGQGQGGPGRMPGFAGGRNAGRGGGQASRGAPMGAPPVTPMQMHAPEAQIPPAPQAEESNLAAKLANMTEHAQKQHLGELLFPRVQDKLTGRFGPDNAGKLASKVTGMFLEMDTPGLLYLLDTEAECSSKIEEALDVLRQHRAMPEGCA